MNFRNAVDALLKMLRTSGMHFYFGSNERIDGAECYSSFMKFLYKDCSRDEHGLLNLIVSQVIVVTGLKIGQIYQRLLQQIL